MLAVIQARIQKKGGLPYGFSNALLNRLSVVWRIISGGQVFDLTNIQTAIFEYNGKMTILPVSSQRPATPNDMHLAVEQELLFTELIMDGRILENNLKRMGLDLTWLDKQLKQRDIQSPQDVFLAVCDRNLKFVLYEKISLKN